MTDLGLAWAHGIRMLGGNQLLRSSATHTCWKKMKKPTDINRGAFMPDHDPYWLWRYIGAAIGLICLSWTLAWMFVELTA